MGIGETWVLAYQLDKVHIKNPDYLLQRSEARFKLFGRIDGLSQVIGAFRATKGVFKVAICGSASLVALSATGVIRLRNKENLFKWQKFAKLSATSTLEGAEDITRGIIEIIPLTGILLAKYDIYQYKKR